MATLIQFPARPTLARTHMLARCASAWAILFALAAYLSLPCFTHAQENSQPELSQLQGKVVDADGKPVAGAKIQGVYLGEPRRDDIKAVSDSHGEFLVQRTKAPLKIYVHSADRKLAGTVRLDAEQSKVDVKIGPVAEVHGHLTDDQGAPAANWQITYGVQIFENETQNNGVYRTCFGGKVTTDAQGNYTLWGLVPGEKYDATVDVDTINEGPEFIFLLTTAPTKAGRIDQEDIKIPKQYRRTTYDQPTAEYFGFSPHENLTERIGRAEKFAAGQFLRVLLIVGDPKSQMAHNLVAAHSGEGDLLLNVLNDFEQLAVSTDDADAMDILKQTYQLDAAQLQPLSLIVLSEDDRVLGTKNLSTENNSSGSHRMLTNAIEDFTTPFALPLPDAEQLLTAAQNRARREGKLVLLEQTGTYCGWCHVLERFFERHPEVFQANFVVMHIDDSRFQHGNDVISRYRKTAGSGIPWCAILDADGNKLADWGGYPIEAKKTDYFLKILSQTAPKITTDQIADLRADLEQDREKYSEH